MPPHPLTSFELQRYYQNKPRFIAVYTRHNLSEVKDGVFVINRDHYKPVGTHKIALYVNGNNVTYSDSFCTEYISKEIKYS